VLAREPQHPVRIRVTASSCPLMKTGDEVFISGPLIDYPRSAPMCLSALVGIYPWVMTARLGVASQTLGYQDGYRLVCPDKLVEFVVTAEELDGAVAG
jgi:uncharacterized repeat protein (TIGR04076 family)